MSSKFSNKYPIPEKFPEILHDFSREVLRYMPRDILDFAIQYFYSLETGSPLNYIEGASKRIPRVIETTTIERKQQLKDKRQDVSTPSLATNQNTQNIFFKQGEQSKKEDEKEELKELKETKSSKMNSPAHSEAGSRPESEMSRGSGIVRTSKIFVNNIFEISQQKVKESMNLHGKKSKKEKKMKIFITKVDILLVIFLVILEIKMRLETLLVICLLIIKKIWMKMKIINLSDI